MVVFLSIASQSCLRMVTRCNVFGSLCVFVWATLQEVMMHQDNTIGTVEVFDIQGADEQAFRAWLQAHLDTGYVGNIPRKNRPNSGGDLLLHCAGCSWLTGQNGPHINQDFYKVCSTDAIDLLHWIYHNGPFRTVRVCSQSLCRSMIIPIHDSRINLVW